MERSFKREVELLKLGAGQVFHGEGILAVTKALLQSGVSYVGGYQGAPVSHLMDVLADSREILDGLGIHFEPNASEAGAAAMLGASINYPLRGAVTFKSTVGTNVASDALSNLASAGVRGGTLLVLGEDYGEGASIIQERTHAFAMKSQMWLLDPRPNLTSIVRMVEQGFDLSEATSTPVMLEMRIRACHVHGSFVCRDNRAPAISRNALLSDPDFDYGRICLPPATYAQEKHKIDVRWPAAVQFIRDRKLNEVFEGDIDEIGIVLQGGMYNATIRALQQLGYADVFGNARVPLYVLNVTYPLIPEEISAFCAGKRAVLVVEEGQPNFIEEAMHAALRRADLQTKVFGKDVLPMAGEYTGAVVVTGVGRFLEAADRLCRSREGGNPAAFAEPHWVPALVSEDLPWHQDLAHVAGTTDQESAGTMVRSAIQAALDAIDAPAKQAAILLGEPVPTRPPGFCVGCPERPVFSAMKLLARETGEYHVSADIGCHTFATLPPFNLGNTVLGYGLGLASSSAVGPMFDKRVVTVMGDGGFWHNGLSSGVVNAVFNNDDGVLVIMKNGYTSATGTQEIPSSVNQSQPNRSNAMTIERTLEGLGVKWMKPVHNYNVGSVLDTLREAMSTSYNGLKVIIADAECMLEQQRRKRPQVAAKLQRGERVVRTRFGVDEDTCTGDHSCIRLSGCPSLTIKDSGDPLKVDPVAHVNNGCVGCGLCGEVAHAAALCPSFYRAEIIQNPNAWDRFVARVRAAMIGWMQSRTTVS